MLIVGFVSVAMLLGERPQWNLPRNTSFISAVQSGHVQRTLPVCKRREARHPKAKTKTPSERADFLGDLVGEDSRTSTPVPKSP